MVHSPSWHPLGFALEPPRSSEFAAGFPLARPWRLVMSRGRIVVLFVIPLLAAMGGCHGQSSQVAPPEVPAVPVSRPVQQEVTDYVDFTGRTDAVQAVNVEARVTGYPVRMPFKEGSEVKKGDLPFKIDPRPYQAQLVQAQGQVALNEASLKLAQTTYERDAPLVAKGAVTQQELDQDKAAVDE